MERKCVSFPRLQWHSRLLTFQPRRQNDRRLGTEPNTVHIWESASGKERGSIHFGLPPLLRSARAAGKMRIVSGQQL